MVVEGRKIYVYYLLESDETKFCERNCLALKDVNDPSAAKFLLHCLFVFPSPRLHVLDENGSDFEGLGFAAK